MAGKTINAIANQTLNNNFTVGNWDAATNASSLILRKSRLQSTITSGDTIGNVIFQAQDGTQYTTASQIKSISSGTIASTRVGSNLELWTHPDSTTASTQRMIVDSAGKVTINAPDSGGVSLTVNSNSSAAGFGTLDLVQANLSAPPRLLFSKNRSGGVINSGDSLCTINCRGYDGTSYIVAAQILAENVGAVATSQVGGRLRFATHPISTSAAATRMSIESTGEVIISAPDSGVGLTISGGGLTVTGDLTNITTFGRTVGVSGIPVVVDNTGLFGTIVSSIRYKENVQDMSSASSSIMSLRPVIFNYKADKDKIRKYGLIAEEVEKIMPDLVVYNDKDEVETVKYLDLPVLLLNELQKVSKELQDALNRIKTLENKLAGG